MTPGIMVQIVSIIWCSKIKRLIILLVNREVIIYVTKIVIIKIIRKEWSWKKINCSIIGEHLSCREILNQVAINKI
jgi:hypothetical protein